VSSRARAAALSLSASLFEKHVLSEKTALKGDRGLLDVSKNAVGFNLKQLRTAKGLTLDQLASSSELTRGYISLVERGLKTPSVNALLRLAAALEVNVTYLFDPNPTPAPRYTLFRQNEQHAPIQEGGFDLVALAASRTRKMMEPFLIRPPLKSAPRASHAGEEFLFVISGKMAIKFEDEEIILAKGDCLYFAGETPHWVRSIGKTKADVLLIVSATSPPR
jgi:transcriptional regulator with XRE-family HTH domain